MGAVFTSAFLGLPRFGFASSGASSCTFVSAAATVLLRDVFAGASSSNSGSGFFAVALRTGFLRNVLVKSGGATISTSGSRRAVLRVETILNDRYPGTMYVLSARVWSKRGP